MKRPLKLDERRALARIARDLRLHIQFQRDVCALDGVPKAQAERAGLLTEPEPAPRKPSRRRGVTRKATTRKVAKNSPKRDDSAKARLQRQCDALKGCKDCHLHIRRKKMVFGEGNPEADLMFIGEGPGRQENEQGRPFVGRAGQLLDSMLSSLGIRRQDVYITNLVACWPPNNRDPQPEEIEACGGRLAAQVHTVKPKVIVTLGRVASHRVLSTDDPISVIRGNWQTVSGIRVMPTYHPSYLLRNEGAKWDTWEDMLMVLDELGISRP